MLHGRLIITKNLSHIEYFNLHLPNEKKLNIDMEWLNGPEKSESVEVDIGYVARMELISSAPSLKKSLSDKQNVSPYMQPISNELYENLLSSIKWDEEISLEEAYTNLEKSFFPFKKVKYYKFLDAFREAEKLNKLVHFILLWGALDDQSC